VHRSHEKYHDVDIMDDILLGWWACLKTLQFAGFKIEFGLYVKKEVDNALSQLDRDIQKLSIDIDALKSKCGRIIYAKSTKSMLIEECLRQASVLTKGKAVYVWLWFL
jgi:hypothetical protein